MLIHKMKLSIEPFEKIFDGSKVIESRLYDEKRQQINAGDQIEFTYNDDASRKITTIVRDLYLHPDFKSLFYQFPPALFGGTSREDLIKEIEVFYSQEEQSRYGVVGIRIEVLSDQESV